MPHMNHHEKLVFNRHDLHVLTKGERVMLRRDTLRNATRHPLVNVSDSAMAGVSNASALAEFYTARHQRYRGIGARWGAPGAAVYINGTRNPGTSVDSIGEAFEMMISPVSGNMKHLQGG